MEIEYSEKKRWVFFGLPLTFTRYDVKENIITINSGFLNKVENDCYMYKVQDTDKQASRTTYCLVILLPGRSPPKLFYCGAALQAARLSFMLS